MFVIIGFRNHGYEGLGEPCYISNTMDSKEYAYEVIRTLPDSYRGDDMNYRVMLIGEEFDEDITW
jgi:hypothetical protein